VTVINYGARNVGEVLIAIDDPDGTLLPDTNVNVTVTTSSEPNTLAVPRETLYSQGGNFFVYRVINNTLVRTPVKTGTSSLTQVSILQGLNEGDLVSTGSVSGAPLQEGVAVKVVQ
jgi:HlyD family secretion protein